MDSVAGRPMAPRRDSADSPNVMVVKDAFDALEAGGVEAALERLLSQAHADLEFHPYLAPERVLRGIDEVRDFFREQLAAGTALTLRPSSIEEDGEEVVVNGSLRVVRPTGGFSESQLRWTYRFRDGLLREARWGPRQAA
jgi:ketosteroid isomerase-like protein